jgi:hypothetical protein
VSRVVLWVLGWMVPAALTMALAAIPVAAFPLSQAQQGPPPASAAVGGDEFSGAAGADDKLSASVSYRELVGTSGDGPRRTAPIRPVSCEVHEAPGGPDGRASENDTLSPYSGRYVEAAWYYQTCRYRDTGQLASSNYWQYTPGNPTNAGPDLAALARQAYDEVPLAFPVPVTSPGIDIDQITGLPTWLWLEPGSWSELSARAEIPGFWVEVTAHPERVVWDMGDGETVTCDGPGTTYDPAVDDDAQSTNCSHVYQHTSVDEPDGQYQASVTIQWSVDWESSTGAGGVLADATRTTTFALTVTERQAVVSYGE